MHLVVEVHALHFALLFVCVCVFWWMVAGCIVKHMGVPLHLVAMVNSNDIVHRAVQSGNFSMADSVKQTLASAIDTQVLYVFPSKS